MSFWRLRRLEINNKIIIQRIEEMYKKYGVDTEFLELLDEEQKIKGMKGLLAELDLNKKEDYSLDDLSFIKKIYSIFC